MALPNFIVIGAPKAGTTALYHYLDEHPDVFMSPVKETNFFGYGVDPSGRLLYGDPEVHRFPIKTLSEYERLFAAAGGAPAVGEASPIYLECPQAAGRIHRLIPGARLICSIRHPVDRAYSDYQMFLRRRGRRLDPARDLKPGAAWTSPDSHHMKIGRYYEQLSRYYQLFPREQIHVMLFDDLTRNGLQTVQQVYRFLQIDPEFVPDMTTPHALGGMPASRMLESFFTSSAVRSTIGSLIPKQAANWARRFRRRNMRQAPSLPAEMKRELTLHFREDLARTSSLIGRSLDHWF